MSTATPAIHFLRKHQVAFVEREYRYEEHGGTRVSARELGVDEHAVVKTLVMEDERREPLYDRRFDERRRNGPQPDYYKFEHNIATGRQVRLDRFKQAHDAGVA